MADQVDAQQAELRKMVWSRLRELYDREAARAWLFGINPLLGDRRPVDVLRAGRAADLLRAIRAEHADGYV